MKIKSLQQGGEMAPRNEGGPEEQIMQMAQQIIEQLGPEAAAMLAEMIMQMLQSAMGGEAEQAPQEPVYQRRGGRLIRR